MVESYLAAAVQMESGLDKAANVAAAERLIRQAADAGAKLIALPELFNAFAGMRAIVPLAEPIPGPTTDRLVELARQLGVVLIGGSIAEQDASGKPFNTSVIITPGGGIVAKYRKIHLFEIDLPGQVTGSEADWFSRGVEPTTVATELGTLGLAICYDLRFPELFRRLVDGGAQIIVVPSAFTRATGKDHWELLLRARAVENQAYAIAPNQCAEPADAAATFGHSLIVDPWGNTLAIAGAGERESVILAKIDLTHVARIRRQLPALANRRLR